MKEKMLVSVIMNCHNGEVFLKESLNSLISQTYKNWELIFWDNNSTDKSETILKQYKDQRIKYFKSDSYSKLYRARNLAVSKANGEFITFLDTDDLWNKEKLEKQIEICKRNKDSFTKHKGDAAKLKIAVKFIGEQVSSSCNSPAPGIYMVKGGSSLYTALSCDGGYDSFISFYAYLYGFTTFLGGEVDSSRSSIRNNIEFLSFTPDTIGSQSRLTFEPQKFTRSVNEGDFKLYYDYRFNNKTEKATVYDDKIDHSKKSIIDFPNCSYDVITSVYYARTLDYSNVNYNDTIQLSMMVDKKIYNDLYIRYLGTETIEDQYGKKHDCIKFSPQLIEGTLFKEGESMYIYVTNDKNRIPIYIEAEIVVGSVKAYIKSMKNIKYPA